MQIVKFKELESYIEKADAYDSPKTIKVVEGWKKETDCRIRAVTFPLTFQMEWTWTMKGEGAQMPFEVHMETLRAHGHAIGHIADSPRVGV